MSFRLEGASILPPPSVPKPVPSLGRWLRCAGWASLMALAACGAGGEDGPQPAFRVSFTLREVPEVFESEGLGRRSSADTPGYWAVVSGLRRPESGVVHNAATGAQVRVALFIGRPEGGGAAELSADAAKALGIGEEPVAVRVVAVREEPQVSAP